MRENPSPTSPLPTAIYARISRDSAGEGLGVDRQEADCRELAERLGWDVTRVFVDNDISAYDRRKVRPQYRAMLEAVKSGEVRGIVAWHTDRLHRRLSDLEELVTIAEKYDLQIQTVKSGDVNLTTPSGRMVARTLGNAAQYEVEHARERMKAKKDELVKEGKYRGGIRPFGFEKDGVTIREKEAEVIRECATAVLAGRTLMALTRELNERGVKPSSPKNRGDGTWKYGALRDMLLRPRNAGILARGLPGKTGQKYEFEEIGPASWKPIIPEEQWRALVAVLTDPNRRISQSTSTKWLGSGIYRCGVPMIGEDGQEHPCGGRLRATPHGGTSMRPYKRRYLYRCESSAHLTIGQERTDDYVRDMLVTLVRDPDVTAMMQPNRSAALDADRTRRLVLIRSLTTTQSDYDNDLIDGKRYKAKTAKIDAEIAEIDARLAAGLSQNASTSIFRSVDPGQAFLDAPIDVQRAVLSTVLSVEVLPAAQRGSSWSSDRLRTTLAVD